MPQNLALSTLAASLTVSLLVLGAAGYAADAPSAPAAATQPPGSGPREPAAKSARLFSPEEAAQHKEVVVVTYCLIGADGHAKSCDVERNSGAEKFGQAAVGYMLRRTYVPAKAADGTPTESHFRLQFRFRADDAPLAPPQ